MIESYEFGRAVVNGREHRADLIILPGRVIPDWWRLEGHHLAPEDLRDIVTAAPRYLIVGAGAYGAVDVPEETVLYLESHGVIVEIYDTARAVKRYNDLAAAGEAVAAALHLTC